MVFVQSFDSPVTREKQSLPTEVVAKVGGRKQLCNTFFGIFDLIK